MARHDSIEEKSPLKLSLSSGEQLDGMESLPGDIALPKSANSGFVGTALKLELRRARIHRLVVRGYFTNVCVETTVRTAGNMGFDTYLVHDACATMNMIGIDGTDYDPELVHDMSVVSMNGEFWTALSTADTLSLMSSDAPNLNRVQGNE